MKMLIAAELSNLKSEFLRDFDGQLKKLASAGYRYACTKDLLNLPPAKLGEVLQVHGIKIIAQSAIAQELQSRPEALAMEVVELGGSWIQVRHFFLDWFGEGWKRAGSRLAPLADQMAQHGLRVAYHNHEKEFKSDEGSVNFEALLEGGGPSLSCHFDVFHCQRAGEDPATWIKRLGSKVKSLRLQDLRGREGCPLGEGEIDWNSVFLAANEVGVEYAVIDLATFERSPIQCYADSLTYLVNLGVAMPATLSAQR
ncbi:MAG: TIM barrel protein [Armatimonadetes bacterium]|nr:TIM barrel protein [Armatimonadota bacterium]